jgi:hypothetical protein
MLQRRFCRAMGLSVARKESAERFNRFWASRRARPASGRPRAVGNSTAKAAKIWSWDRSRMVRRGVVCCGGIQLESGTGLVFRVEAIGAEEVVA